MTFPVGIKHINIGTDFTFLLYATTNQKIYVVVRNILVLLLTCSSWSGLVLDSLRKYFLWGAVVLDCASVVGSDNQ